MLLSIFRPQKVAACVAFYHSDVQSLPLHLAAFNCKVYKKKVKSIGPLLCHAIILTHAIRLPNPVENFKRLHCEN